MDKSNLFRTKPKRDKAIDTTLDIVDTSLKVLDGAVDFLPGVGAVVNVLQLIVKQLRKTRSNSKTAEELTKQVQDLVQLLDETIKDVKNRVDSSKQVTGVREIDFGPDNFDGSKQIATIVEELLNELKNLSDAIMNICERNSYVKFWRNSDLESQLVEVKERLENAVKGFRTKREIIVGVIVEHLESTVRAIQKSIMNNKYDDDLRALPFVNASYKAVGDSDYQEGTRVELIGDAQDWASSSASSNFFTLSGAAGTGKSTVVREISRRLEDEGHLGASFFFVRSDAGALGSMHSVFPTITFQLASLQSTLRPYIANAAREFTRFQSRSLKEQLETLILAPLSAAQGQISDLPEKPIVIVLDALDEASGDLDIFLDLLKVLVDKHPRLRILITTRPESPILHAFSKAGISASSRRVEMEHIDRDVVDGDIRHFFKASFDKLRWRNELCSAHPDAIEVLTRRAEGLFIYARTVINHLSVNKPEKAVHRLSVILDDTRGPAGLSALDRLYMFVLDNVYDEEDMGIPNVRRRVTAVLAALVVLQDQVTIKVLAPLMEVTEDEAVRTVEELRSIVSCSGPDLRKDTIRPLHLTLREFLVDKERCKNSDFFIDRLLHHEKVAGSCLRILNNELRHDMCQLGGAFKDGTKSMEWRVREHVPAHVQYASAYWSVHVVENEPSTEVRAHLGVFCKENLLEWVETMSLMNRLRHGIQALLRMHSWGKDRMDLGDISSIIYDGYRLVAMFFDAINSCPEQIYTSGLSFSPECALVKLYAKDRRSNCLVSPRDVVWGPCVHVLKHTYGREITLSDDGRLLALAGPFGVEIRDAATLDLRKNFEYAEETTSANFHPSNHSFVFLSRNGTVEERSLIANTHRRYRCELPEEDIKDDTWISSVAYSSDGTRIVCYWGGVDAILVWSNKDCSQSPMKIPTPAMTFKTFSFISDGMHIDALFSATDNLPVLKRWNVDSGEEVNSLEISSEEITTAVFSKNNTVLITGYINKICVWSLDGNCITQLNTITGNWGDITAIDVTQSGDIIASGGVDTVIRLWDASSLAPLAFYPGHTRSIKSLRFSPQGDRLVSISFDNSTRVWHTKKEDLHLTSSNNSRILKNAVFSPNGEYIATSAGSDILVWDGKKGTYLTTFTGHSEVIRSLGFSKDGSLLASVSSVDGVFLWDVRKKGTVPRTLPDSNRIGSHTLFSIAANTTGDQLAVIYGDDCIENNRPEYSFWVGTWDLSTYKGEESSEVGIKMLQSKHIIGFRPHFVRFSPREALVLVRYFELKYESKVVIWDCPSDTMEAHDYDEDRHSASKPDFSIEENWIVSNRTGRQMLWLPESRKPFYRVFTARGNLVAIGSETGELSLLDMSPFMNLR